MQVPAGRFGLGSRDLRAYVFLAAAVALFVSLSEILDYFELPFESLVGHLAAPGSPISIGFVLSSMTSFGYAGVFTLMLLESASLPIPSELVLPLAGYLVSKGDLNFAIVVLVSTGAGIMGALADYFIALKVGRPLIERLGGSWAGSRRMERAEAWLNSKGALSILLARFVPGIRSSISFPAGALKMKMRTFLTMTLLGSFGWSFLLVYLGSFAGNLWQTTAPRQSALLSNEAILLVVALGSAAYVAYYVSREVKGRRVRRATAPRAAKRPVRGASEKGLRGNPLKTTREEETIQPGRKATGGGASCCWKGVAGRACGGEIRPVVFSDGSSEMCWTHFKLVLLVQQLAGAVN